MSTYTQSIQTLINELASLPGIGMRSAERIAFHLLKQTPEKALKLAAAIHDVKTRISLCSICFNLTEADPCPICSDTSRDASVVCVVEQPKDLLSLESAGLYKGVYHVLQGKISPQDQIGPSDLTLEALIKRIEAGTIREVILGTNPTLEGDGTALHIQQLVAKIPNVQVTRLARGLPAGGNIEYANKNILSDALLLRQKMQ